MPLNEKATKKYWNDRVLGAGSDPQALVYADSAHFANCQNISEKVIELFVKPGQRVLDVGCGYGRFYQTFKKAGAIYHGVDFSEEMIKLARTKNPDGNFEVADWNNLYDLEPLTFDVVFECICLSSVPEDDVEHFGRKLGKLAQNGILIMVEPQGVNIISYKKNIFS